MSASFDCKKAKTRREKLICSNEQLKALDSELGQVYRDALKRASSSSDRDLLKYQQQSWLVIVADECADPQCLEAAMKKRIASLREQAGKPQINVAVNPRGDEGKCTTEVSSQTQILRGDVRSEARTSELFCDGGAHPGCDMAVVNTIKRKPLAIQSLFKKGMDPVRILKEICIKMRKPDWDPAQDDGMNDLTSRCEEIALDHLGLAPEGIVIFFDRNGPYACGPVPPITWKQLKGYLDPKGPVLEAR